MNKNKRSNQQRPERALTQLLRHSYAQNGLKPVCNMYFELDSVIKSPKMSPYQLRESDIKLIVHQDNKQRFSVLYEGEDPTDPKGGHTRLCSEDDKRCIKYIRANQGHSVKNGPVNIQLQRILLDQLPINLLHKDKFAFHGTTYSALTSIVKDNELRAMERVHIHFSRQIPEERYRKWTTGNMVFPNGEEPIFPAKISGMRYTSECALIVSIPDCLRNYSRQVKWEISQNEVILASSISSVSTNSITLDCLYGLLDLDTGALYTIDEVRNKYGVKNGITPRL